MGKYWFVITAYVVSSAYVVIVSRCRIVSKHSSSNAFSLAYRSSYVFPQLQHAEF